MNRNILWDAIGGKKKVVLIKWDIVCCPKRIGGLGIRKTAEMNKALLSKLGWKIEDGDQGLRAHVLRAKYLKGKPLIHAITKSNTSCTWRSICSTRELVKQGCSKLVTMGETLIFGMINA